MSSCTRASHVLVYDAGARFSERFDAGSAVVVPYLRTIGARSVDMLVVSHDDNDHRGGVKALLQAMPVRRWLLSEPGAGPMAIPTEEACRRGHRWNWDGVGFEILWPDQTEGLARNDRSCVLRIETAGGAVLLPGDIERPAEARLVGRASEKLRADVLVLAHHGSRSSSTGAFLDAVQPSVAVISSGYLNRFGHPHPEVIEAVTVRRIAIRDTRTGGALRIRIGRTGFGVRAYRQSHGRYFHSK